MSFQIQLIFHTEMPKYMLDMKTGINKYETSIFLCNKCFSDNFTFLLHYLLENVWFVAITEMGITAQVTHEINTWKYLI